jgi:hypothetical protein
MNLRQVARADLQAIVRDSAGGFGWPVVVTAPDGTEAALTGLTTDIAQVVDADTGALVSGRLASVALPMADVLAAFGELPRAIEDETAKPWRVAFDDIEGKPWLFRVDEATPDRALGVVLCMLGLYR